MHASWRSEKKMEDNYNRKSNPLSHVTVDVYDDVTSYV